MQTRTVTLETSWPSMYHDLIAEGLSVCRRPVALRTQSKNAARESDKFSPRHPFLRAGMRVSYTGQQVLTMPSKTILEVMCNVTGTDYATADYRLPVPPEWFDVLTKIMSFEQYVALIGAHKPLLVYRPLVARNEWRGSMARNADPGSYAEVFNSVRDKFFVISVADLAEGQEWIVGPEAKADLTFHKGELVFEALAALFGIADLVLTSSGFAAVLGPAVGTPTISIVGGYEDPRCHDSGARFSPYLVLGPRTPCSCWTSACMKVCDKKIEMPAALAAVDAFVSENCTQT
jgi:hypothetical protein